jgi:hypothetical protein
VNRVSIATLLRELDVEVIPLPIRYRLPAGFIQAWGNQFYIFDIIRQAAQALTNERLLVFDSDCLFVRSVEEMEAAIDRHGALTYTIELDKAPEFQINGLSRLEMAEIGRKVFGIDTDFVHYSGGEMFAASASELRALVPLLDRLWDYSVQSSKRLFPHEEAHALSILYRAMGYKDFTANQYIKRIWTTLRKGNVAPDDLDLTVWHLPAEKKRGFGRLFKDCANRSSEFNLTQESDEIRRYYSRIMGVPARGPLKFTLDLSAKMLEHSGKYLNKLTQAIS